MDLSEIPEHWIDSAKAKLHIGYGHTSHGSQIITGMNALESYYTSGLYDWSHEGGSGELHLFEGSGYNTGYLELDVGYGDWDTETRTYLNDVPDCNVIMWSWCGQVNSTNLTDHYFSPMSQLEEDYPNVTFIYMTGHLEGLGPEGSVFSANQQIRDYCTENNKILFDFSDIEKYSPDNDTNYQQYFADDACEYIPHPGDTLNWADIWMANNPSGTLSEITDVCGSCSHSRKINCVKKGIAIWYLWAKLAGWERVITTTETEINNTISVYPNPVVHNQLTIQLVNESAISQVEVFNMQGKLVYSQTYNKKANRLVSF